MIFRWIEREITYDGTQLCSNWIIDEAGTIDDAIVSFTGPADVPIENMVDLEDVARNAPIFSRMMLHFIAGHPGTGLPLAIARQRLLVAIAAQELRKNGAATVIRRGDDIYDGDRKLSVSIATTSPKLALIHFAVNIESAGTPVPTKGLIEYNIDPKKIADTVARLYCNEIESMAHAGRKVRAVK